MEHSLNEAKTILQQALSMISAALLAAQQAWEEAETETRLAQLQFTREREERLHLETTLATRERKRTDQHVRDLGEIYDLRKALWEAHALHQSDRAGLQMLLDAERDSRRAQEVRHAEERQAWAGDAAVCQRGKLTEAQSNLYNRLRDAEDGASFTLDPGNVVTLLELSCQFKGMQARHAADAQRIAALVQAGDALTTTTHDYWHQREREVWREAKRAAQALTTGEEGRCTACERKRNNAEGCPEPFHGGPGE